MCMQHLSQPTTVLADSMSDATSPSRKHGPLQPQSSGSGRTMMTAWRQQPYLHEPISSKHVCFYKSGDSQFSGLPVVINNRTFKTFESLLDSLSRRVPLPFGVRTITTPRGHTTVHSLDQLQNGHSYICSDQRTVKPVDLERARRRPPPWYHARPASGPRRRALHQPQRLEIRPRRRGRRGRESTPHLLSTPKRLVVFRNGEPEERHTLLLQRRSARSFEALLDYMSEVMRFPVVKLYMPDGRRVDGLPTLILCSGVLVAAGREPFKVGDYDTQRPTAPTWLPAKRVGTKWVHPSHQRFFVNQIHNSVAGSAGDYPINAAGSVEMETGNPLGSLAGTDILTYGEAMGDTQTLPDDDIEKSFRVNQDGSMTVEMKVRLTIKEEETVHWTTTLSRSAASNQMGESSIISGDVNTGLRDNSHLLPDLDPDAAAMETSCYNQDLPPPMMDSAYSEQAGEKEEEEQGRNAQVLSSLAHRVPTPGPRKAWQMQASVENAEQGPEREGQEGVVGSYSYREEKQEYCMVRQTTNRPVPKPRNATLSETNKTMNSSTSMQSQYKSAEVLKLQNSGEEIRETVLHIYEQQTCQDNFVANTQVRVQGVSLYSPLHGRPATSETVFPASSERTFRSSSLDLESEQNLSSASKSNSRGKQNDNLLLSSNFNTPLCQTSVGTDKCSTAVLGKKISDSNQQTAEYNGDTQILTKKRKPVKFVLKKNSHIFQSTASEKKRSEHVAEILKGIRRRKNNPGTSVGLVKGAERLRVKTAQKLLKKRQRMRAAEYDVPGSDKSSLQKSSAEDTTQVKEHQNELSKAVTEDKKAEKSETLNVTQKRNVLEVEGLRGKVALIRQTSMHDEKRTTRETVELSESVSLPALNSSSFMINEYVEQWLLKSRDDAISELEEAPPCNTDLNSESASQTGDEPRALFHVSTDREASFEIGCEMIHMTEDPSGDALTASLPSLVQLSQISQDPFEADTERRPQTSNVVATQKSYTVRMAARPDMRPVVEQLCLSIHSIKETTQQKRPSCLEKSNSLPDFSSHIASTFGSSTRVLLAFLSVMTLKDGLANLNSNKQPGIDNLSYSEALRLLDSLKELARIEDAHVLSESLSALQNSISRHLLQSWRGFQELRDQVRSRSVTPSSSESEGPPDVEPEEEKVIQELMGELGVPERVREELAKLNSTGEKSAYEQASIKETLATIKGQASHFQNVKMKFTENIVGGTNQEKIPEEHKLTVESAGESYPNQNTVTVQQSEEYFKEESYDQESTESYHKELDAEEGHYEEMAESLPEFTLNSFTDSHPVEDAASVADSGMGENVTQSSVALSNSNLMPNVSSGEQNSADEKGQHDSKCQFIYMDSQAEHLAQSKAESDIHPGRQLSDEKKSSQEEMLMEEQKNTDETENKGVEIPRKEPTEEETEAVEPQISVEEEKPSSSEGLEDEEDEDDICEELMGLSDEQTKIEEFMTGTPEAKRSPSVKEIRQTILNNTSSQLINTSRSSPASRVTSPLAFSYDSRSRDSEGSPQANRVKSIREMFLAKSSSENQFVQRRQPGPLRTDRSESRPATSDSGATGSQHSPDVSSAEEDTGRMAIAKGYVRRTIERLYGGGGTGKAPEANRPPSASKGKRKEALLQNTVRSLAAVHEARSRVISDLSYFNATSSFDITEPTQCIAMNAQVGSKNAVLIDEGRWLMRENHPLQTTLLESPGTPANMKSSSSDYECETTKGDRKEDAPYSHFSSAKSHSTDTEEPVVPHCTYLTLPHGGDSEPEEDEPCPKADPSKKKKEQKVAPITEAPKACSERNGVLPAFIPEFKKSNNKVHPLMDFLPLSPPVMTQPSKRQASQATQMGVAQRTAAEPDFLEMLYLACGEHCPFL
ncbi:oxygen-regulated protein 1 [Alosa pseudoharengus]|uniref:oxygen-regulated protein 1 n=1 Tax=Alosa pseudoharengus TaxID=34774 RepID=UPI003F893EA5